MTAREHVYHSGRGQVDHKNNNFGRRIRSKWSVQDTHGDVGVIVRVHSHSITFDFSCGSPSPNSRLSSLTFSNANSIISKASEVLQTGRLINNVST